MNHPLPVGYRNNDAFTLASPWSPGEPLDVVVELAYVDPEDSMSNGVSVYPAQWQNGTLRVTAADGTRLTLSPDTGDVASFSISFDGEAGDPMILNWADEFQLICASDIACS